MRPATTRNACPTNRPSRKPFAETRLRSLARRADGVGTNLYSRQDTRMYYYSYAWVALAHIFVRAHTRRRIHRTHAHGMPCPDSHRSCLSNRYIGPFSLSSFFLARHSRSPVIRNFTSYFKTHDAAISRPTMRAPLAHPFFFSAPLRILDDASSPRLPCETRETETSSMQPSDIFIPLLGNLLH